MHLPFFLMRKKKDIQNPNEDIKSIKPINEKIIFCSGISGSERKGYLSEVEEYSDHLGKKVKVYDLENYIKRISEERDFTFSKDRFLNRTPDYRAAIRAAAFEVMLKDIDKDINKNSWIDWSMVPYCKIEESKLKDYSLKKGDIVIARMADPGKVGIIEIDIPAVFASYLIRLSPKIDRIKSYYLFYCLTSPTYQDFILGASTGTTRASANAKVITDFDIVIPPREIVQKFETAISKTREMTSVMIMQNANLRQTRDMLLPRLISGERM